MRQRSETEREKENGSREKPRGREQRSRQEGGSNAQERAGYVLIKSLDSLSPLDSQSLVDSLPTHCVEL